MAKLTVRHLVELPGAMGKLPRYFWMPSPGLRKLGCQSARVPLDWASHHEAGALLAAAIARAEDLNKDADAIRLAALLGAAGIPTPTRGTLADLMTNYQASEDYTRLAPATKRGYQQCFKRLQDWAGDLPVRAIAPRNVQAFLAAHRATPAFAGAIVRVLRLVLAYGLRHGWVSSNAAEKPKIRGAEPRGVIWPRGAVDAFVAAADAMGRHSIGTAVLMNEWLGQREADVLRAPRLIYRNGTLMIRQSKTKANVTLPIDMVPRLKERLGTELARTDARLRAEGRPAALNLIINESTGLAYTADAFRHRFAEVRDTVKHLVFEVDHLLPGRDMADPQAFKVGMKDLTFMVLRHTAVTRLGELGLEPQLIASISGHSLDRVLFIMERYMVRTAKMARVAFQARMDAEGMGPGGERDEGVG
jgi:hypothetical protein